MCLGALVTPNRVTGVANGHEGDHNLLKEFDDVTRALRIVIGSCDRVQYCSLQKKESECEGPMYAHACALAWKTQASQCDMQAFVSARSDGTLNRWDED